MMSISEQDKRAWTRVEREVKRYGVHEGRMSEALGKKKRKLQRTQGMGGGQRKWNG